jgi:predicted permease
MFDSFIAGLRALFHRDRRNADIEREIDSFLQASIDDKIRSGMSRDQALRAARAEIGSSESVRGKVWSAGWESAADSFFQDLRFAFRQLRKNPGFATTAILILTLGIAAGVCIFSFVDAALIRPLPYTDPSRLVILFESNSLGPRFHVSWKDYIDWKNQNTVFSSLDLYVPVHFMLQTPTGMQKADGTRVSAGFFSTLGVSPILGRGFRANEDQASAPRPVLLSYSAWQRRYGARPDAVGQTVVLDGQTNTIIGVLPRDFHFQPAEPADFWSTERADGECEKFRGCHNGYVVARLRPGVTLAAAFANMKTVVAQLERLYPDSNRGRGVNVLPATSVIVGDIRTILLVLLAGAALLLLIAAVNVASLLLVRSEGRRREIAVRGAIGASRGRLARQFVTEGFVLALTAGVAGTALAALAMRSFVSLIPRAILATMPYFGVMDLNIRVLLFAILVSLGSALLFSLIPVTRIRLSGLREGLTENSRGSSGTLWRRLGSQLVIVEIAMAVILLTGAGLLGKSFYFLLHATTGLDPDRLATLQVSADGPAWTNPALISLEKQIEARAAALPGVRTVGFTSQLPFGDGDGTIVLAVLGQPHQDGLREVMDREVSTRYFSTIQAQLIQGRYFTETDDDKHPLVGIINQQLAKQFFSGQDPVGQFVYSDGDTKAHVRIVGVVNDIQEGQLDAAPRSALYVPFYQTPPNDFAILLRTTQPGDSLLSALDTAVHGINSSVATFEPSSMNERLNDSPSAWLHRSSAWIVGGFAVLALLLSVVGLYGVIAYSVSRRTREIGIRMALGAQRSSVSRLILREAGQLAVIGIAAGILCALAASTLLRSLLFRVQTWDLATLAAVAIVLGSAALLASFFPAHRAASVNPTEALHAE